MPTIRTALLLLFTSWLSTGVCAGDYPPVDVTMELQRVSEHVWMVQGAAGMASENAGFISNAVAIVTTQGVIVIDSLGSPSLATLFLDKIRALTRQPVKTVIVTHYHADHIYGLQVFKDLGADIIAPRGSHDYLNAPTAQDRLEERRLSLDPWVNDDTRLITPDTIVSNTTRLNMADVTLTLNYLGAAHSDGDMSVLVEPDQVLISGDIIFEGRLPFVGNADTRQWLKVLHSLRNSGPRALIPGHGPPATDPARSVALTIDYLEFLRDRMGAAAEDMTPFAEAYNSTDWSRFESLPAFAASNRHNAYGVYLSMEREMLEQ